MSVIALRGRASERGTADRWTRARPARAVLRAHASPGKAGGGVPAPHRERQSRGERIDHETLIKFAQHARRRAAASLSAIRAQERGNPRREVMARCLQLTGSK